ncbi:hypothetical protein [Prochlorococcus sp. MIT 1306]|uniref:hypothetical protein n=1 Tax=Prochlorococcus sp. MIT 1306 TaxID=1799667 RepID=UPI001E3B05A4|nr:hypothetical protein [Prochlorococcus sp. MIT 1306]
MNDSTADRDEMRTTAESCLFESDKHVNGGWQCLGILIRLNPDHRDICRQWQAITKKCIHQKGVSFKATFAQIIEIRKSNLVIGIRALDVEG